MKNVFRPKLVVKTKSFQGGIKAVVCTDCIQTVVMIGSMVLTVVKGTNDLGGFEVVWSRNLEGERLNYPE